MILAVGNSGSYEIAAFQAVVSELEKNGASAILFKQDKCLDGEGLFFEAHDGQTAFKVMLNNMEFNIEDFSAIWYLKPHLPTKLLRFEPAAYRQFIDRQFRKMRTALWSVFANKHWVDDPWSVEKAENKIFQMTLANRIGFTIPDTLITSDPNKVRKFYGAHSEGIIVKLLAVSPMIDNVIYTNTVTPEHLTKIDSVKMSPSIFQVAIPKAHELRITIVGDNIFAAKIHSQEDEYLALDWRRKPKLNDFEVKMEPVSLPPIVENKLRMFMRSLGLQFGCVDMIVTPDGDYVFLEINPNGQWYFVQLNIEAKIGQAIAELLLGKRGD